LRELRGVIGHIGYAIALIPSTDSLYAISQNGAANHCSDYCPQNA